MEIYKKKHVPEWSLCQKLLNDVYHLGRGFEDAPLEGLNRLLESCE